MLGAILHVLNAFIDVIFNIAFATQASLSIQPHNVRHWPAYPHHAIRIIEHLQVSFIPGHQIQITVNYTHPLA